MRILIATGIYPPDIGGPAQYARGVEEEWKRRGHGVHVCTFRSLKFFPSGIRHAVYFLWVLARALRSDFIFIPDTFSAALPAVIVGKLLRKKTIIRTGGDFLWEHYVENSGDLVSLPEFYRTRLFSLNIKEKLIFRLIRFALNQACAVVFSTEWQKKIFEDAYSLNATRCFVVENFYGGKLPRTRYSEKNFLFSGRKLSLKNAHVLRAVFETEEVKKSGAKLQEGRWDHAELQLHLKKAYAIIVPSLSEISPNIILEAVRHGIPFVLTRETGIFDRLKEIGVWVDPLDSEDIMRKVLWLSQESNREEQRIKIESFNFSHTYEQISDEILHIARI